MKSNNKIPLGTCIEKEYLDQLRTMAAKQNLSNTNQVTSVSSIVRWILKEYLDEVKRVEAIQNGEDKLLYIPSVEELKELVKNTEIYSGE
jgi:hypothetical protein